MDGFPAPTLLLAAAALVGSSASATTYETVLVIEPVYWQADAPCDAALELDLEDLPGGSLRDMEAEDASDKRVFRPAAGGRIVIERPEIVTYDLFGDSYADVYTDLVERKPLGARSGSESVFTVAKIETQIGYTSMTETRSGGNLSAPEAKVLEEDFVLTLSPRISLARWVGYAEADAAQQSLWDRVRCENIHHELGHLFVTAQLFEETVGDALQTQGQSSAEVSKALRAWFNGVIARVETRQERYHEEIRKMGVAAANARPYRELGFPWLDAETEASD